MLKCATCKGYTPHDYKSKRRVVGVRGAHFYSAHCRNCGDLNYIVLEKEDKTQIYDIKGEEWHL